ncbi:MAG TPA: phage baseplate upper protein [Staphylococcus saprophyticus]|nr:phage baseplate upper protein [Staphylococcus saprophyticus]
MKKIIDMSLETTAHYQPLSKLNVRLWNQDMNISVLRFLITRDNFPLSLSSENVKIIIAIENGENFISSEDFDISSEVDGVASFQIPNDFMAAATGECVGQVYVGTLDNDEVIVQRKFTFQVENDLLSSIPSELKLQYIKTFSDLRQDVQDRITALENEFVVMEDYVVAVNQATTDGLNALNNLVNAKTVEYNNNHADKLALINNTVDGYVQDFLDQRSYIDTKYIEFQTAVAGSEVVTDADAESWQKYKLTDDSGVLPIVNLRGDLEALQALPSGFYYISFVPITGMGQTSSTGFVTVWESNGGQVKHISFKPYNSSQEFIMRYYNEWSGWENKFDGLEKSIDAQAKANASENNAKVYTDEKVKNQHSVLFEGSANGVGQTINMIESMSNYSLIIISGSTPAGDFDKPVLVNQNSGNNIIINIVNLVDSSGNLGSVYELKLAKTNNTTLTIANDVFFDYGTNSGSGPDANRFTIKRIEGWK